MILQDNEFGIGILCKGNEMKNALIITREALERLRDEYKRDGDKYYSFGAFSLSNCADGKEELLEELLKLFEDAKV